MISVYFCIYLTNRCIVIFCLPTRVIIPYKSKFYNYFSVYFVIFSFNAKFIYIIGNPFNFEKNVKAYLFFPKGGTCKRSISMKMWKDGFEPKLEN